MPVGLVGSGKTTVTRPLAEHFGLIRISTDEIRKRFKSAGYSYEGAREISQELTEKYLDFGYSVAVDANTGSPRGLAYNEKTKKLFPNVRQLFIHINPPVEFIINKLKNYPHTWLFKDAEHAIERFNFHKDQFKLPDLPFVYTFDTSRDDLHEQIKQGIAAIEKTLSQK